MHRRRATLLFALAVAIGWFGLRHALEIEAGGPGPDKDWGYRISHPLFSHGYVVELWRGSLWLTEISPPRSYQFAKVSKRAWDKDSCRLTLVIEFRVEDSVPFGGETSVQHDFCSGESRVLGVLPPPAPFTVVDPPDAPRVIHVNPDRSPTIRQTTE